MKTINEPTYICEQCQTIYTTEAEALECEKRDKKDHLLRYIDYFGRLTAMECYGGQLTGDDKEEEKEKIWKKVLDIDWEEVEELVKKYG